MTVGKVQLNICISKDMKFNNPIVTKGKGSIMFLGIMDVNVGVELFCLIVKEDDVHGLFQQLKAITG